MHFELGDVVRVVGLPNSEWQNSRGTVVKILVEGPTAEYALELDGGGRRWFLSHHLVRSIPEKLVRFFRSEVAERWKQLDANAVSSLNGDRDQLIQCLQERCEFTTGRATVEVDEFFDFFQRQMKRASAA